MAETDSKPSSVSETATPTPPTDDTSLAEFRLYVVHGTLTQDGKDLPDVWDGKSEPSILRWLLTDAKATGGYVFGGAPFVMDGNTLTWAGKDMPNPDCAALVASTSFSMQHDSFVSQKISIPKEAGLFAPARQAATMTVVCQRMEKKQLRLWALPRRLDDSAANETESKSGIWTKVTVGAPQDAWQLMILRVSDEKGLSKSSMLLCWRFQYGVPPEPGHDQPEVKVGSVAITRSPASDEITLPKGVAEEPVQAEAGDKNNPAQEPNRGKK